MKQTSEAETIVISVGQPANHDAMGINRPDTISDMIQELDENPSLNSNHLTNFHNLSDRGNSHSQDLPSPVQYTQEININEFSIRKSLTMEDIQRDLFGINLHEINAHSISNADDSQVKMNQAFTLNISDLPIDSLGIQQNTHLDSWHMQSDRQEPKNAHPTTFDYINNIENIQDSSNNELFNEEDFSAYYPNHSSTSDRNSSVDTTFIGNYLIEQPKPSPDTHSLENTYIDSKSFNLRDKDKNDNSYDLPSDINSESLLSPLSSPPLPHPSPPITQASSPTSSISSDNKRSRHKSISEDLILPKNVRPLSDKSLQVDTRPFYSLNLKLDKYSSANTARRAFKAAKKNFESGVTLRISWRVKQLNALIRMLEVWTSALKCFYCS